MKDNEEEAPKTAKERAVREFWFKGLPPAERDGIVKPHFEKANPTNAKVKEQREKYEEDQFATQLRNYGAD